MKEWPMKEWLKTLPKAELHLHIEGTLEPELMMALADKNGVDMPYADAAEAHAAYDFDNLQSFLDLYYMGMSVLQTADDFRALTMAYFERAHADGVVHVDVSFDPQAHTGRGVALDTVFEGLTTAMRDAQAQLGLTTSLIMSFLRDNSAQDAMQTLDAARPWYDHLSAVGLDSAEQGHPPEKFTAVFEQARQRGLPRVAHAGEEGSAAYIRGALDALTVCRIDHGVRCLEDDALVARLRDERIPLTVCPLSNVALAVVDELADHPLPQMIDAGLNVSLNSDDPAYFGGGVLTNYVACHEAWGWDREQFRTLAANAVRAAFMSEQRRAALLEQIAQV